MSIFNSCLIYLQIFLYRSGEICKYSCFPAFLLISNVSNGDEVIKQYFVFCYEYFKNSLFISCIAHSADIWFIAVWMYLGLLRLPIFIHPQIFEIYIILSHRPLHFKVMLINVTFLRWYFHLDVIYLKSSVF